MFSSICLIFEVFENFPVERESSLNMFFFQDYFPYRVSQVFVLKPDGYREKHLSINSHKYNFEVSQFWFVISKLNLNFQRGEIF